MKYRRRRVIALVIDAAALLLVWAALLGHGLERAVAGLVAAALVVWLVAAFRGAASYVFWAAIAVNLVYLLVFLPVIPILGALHVAACAGAVISGHSPGTFVASLTLVLADGSEPRRETAGLRGFLAMPQALAFVAGAAYVALMLGVRIGGAVGALGSVLVMVGALIASQAFPGSLIDQVMGTRLTHRPGPRLKPRPINIYGGALWGSTVGLDLELDVVDDEPQGTETLPVDRGA